MKATITRRELDQTDRFLLGVLQRDCRVPLQRIAKQLRVPKSTVHYRIRRLERDGVIEGYYAKLKPSSLGNDHLAVVLVRARYGPGYHTKVGRKLARFPGVWGVYYVLGDIDFVVLIRASDTNDYMKKLEQISSMRDIERTTTLVVASVFKEDARVDM